MNRRIKWFLLLSFVFLSTTLNSNHVYADREAPLPVEPVIYNNLRIIAENTPETMGIIKAYDETTDKPVWSSKVYRVKINKWIEADTQWIFIKSMSLEQDVLVVVDEKNRTYKLNPENGHNLDKKLGNGVFTGVLLILLLGSVVITSYRIYIKRKLTKRL